MSPYPFSAYTCPTASMPVDTEAPHLDEAASESYRGAFPIASARCAEYPAQLEWVPDREQPVVPPMMAALCRRCPARQPCLFWALIGQEQGYWAGCTTTDRLRMLAGNRLTLEDADQLQAIALAEATHGALHSGGEGSYWWYRRRGCRCLECRQTNAAARAHERTKARDRATCAA